MHLKDEGHTECARAIEEHVGERKMGTGALASSVTWSFLLFLCTPGGFCVTWSFLIALSTPGVVGSALLLLPPYRSRQHAPARRRGRRRTLEGTQRFVRPHRLMLHSLWAWATSWRRGAREPEREANGSGQGDKDGQRSRGVAHCGASSAAGR